MATSPKKQWFDLRDSGVWDKEKKAFLPPYNVEARFSDHPVLNSEKSRAARHSVYDVGIVCLMRVKRVEGDVPAIVNASPHTLRFDKGSSMRQVDFEAAKKLIIRARAAWDHYQTFREAPVTEMERLALKHINEMPIGGHRPQLDGDEDEEEVDAIDEMKRQQEEERESRKKTARSPQEVRSARKSKAD